MKKDVVVKLTGIHERNGEKPEKVVTKANGTYENIEDYTVIKYIEESEDSSEQIENVLKLFENRAEITRNGQIAAKMVFDAGSSFDTVYRTPFGEMDMTINTKEFERRIFDSTADETSGKSVFDKRLLSIRIRYVLEAAGKELSKSYIRYEIEEK